MFENKSKNKKQISFSEFLSNYLHDFIGLRSPGPDYPVEWVHNNTSFTVTFK